MAHKEKIVDFRDLKNAVIKRAKRIANLRKYFIVAGAWRSQHNYSVNCNRSNIDEAEMKGSYDKRLVDALESLGRLGSKSHPTDGTKAYYIGNCAEQRACNGVLKNDKSLKLRIEQIEFTRAYRVRTLQIKDYCYNCRTALGLHN